MLAAPVEDVGVQPAVHALAGPSGAEAAAASHQRAQYTGGDKVVTVVRARLEAQHQVRQLRHRRRAQRDVRQVLLDLRQI